MRDVMSYLVISLDLIAGLLVGIHLWVPGRFRQQWDRWLLENLAPDDAPVDEKTVKGSIIITALVVIAVMAWGYFTDINKGTFTSQELLNVSLLVVAGVPIAALLLFIVILLYQKITLTHRIPLVLIITIFSLVAVPLIILLINVTNRSLDSMIIGLVFSLALMTLLVQLLPLARRFFTFESGVLARLGVTVFIIGKIIQIISLR